MSCQVAAQTAAKPAWSFIDVDCGLRVVATSGLPATNHAPAAEQFQLSAGMGSQAFAVRAITAAPVISELEISLPIRSSKAGLQMSVRVVLPRTNQADGSPFTVLIPGPKYSKVSEWETLRLANLPQALERQIRVLRSSVTVSLDAREAFVDLVVVNVYGGKGRWQVALANPEVNGVSVRRSVTEAELADVATHVEPSSHTIRTSGAMITIDGRPLAPRIIHPHGESWEFLKQLGFNCVWLSSPPTAAQVAEATALDLWIVAPPPNIPQPTGGNRLLLRRVIAWDLAGSGPSLDAQADLADRLRDRYGDHCRPLVCGPHLVTSQASRIAEAMVHQRAVLGTTSTISAYRAWLQRQIDSSLPGTIHWASITTENPPELVAQIIGQARLLPLADLATTALLSAEPAHVHRLVITALATGARGIVVNESTRLDQTDTATRIRAATLASLNHQLQFMEPWIAGSHAIRWQTTADPLMQMGVFELERGTLAVPVALGTNHTGSSQSTAAKEIPLTLAQPSDDAEVYLLHHHGLQHVASERVAGGVRWKNAAAELQRTLAILVTSDRGLARDVAAELKRTRQQVIRNKQQLAQWLLEETETVARECSHQFVSLAPPDDLQQARQALRKSARAVQMRDFQKANQTALACLAALDQWRHATRQTVIGPLSPADCPLAGCFRTLPSYAAWRRVYPQAACGVNLLRGGQCESLDALHQCAWTFGGHQQPLADGSVTLSPRGQQGSCLRLATDLPTVPGDEQPLVWVTSPPVLVAAGNPVRIDGWLRLRPQKNSQLLAATVFDSWTGTTLARRFGTSTDWQSFTIYRVGTGHPLTITCALHAAGELLIDNLQVSPLCAQADQRLARQDAPSPTR